MSLPRLVLVVPGGLGRRPLSPFYTVSFAVHAFVLALVVVAPSFGPRRSPFDDAMVVDVVGSLPGAPATKTASPPPRASAPAPPAPPKEGVRTLDRPVVPPDPAKKKPKKEEKREVSLPAGEPPKAETDPRANPPVPSVEPPGPEGPSGPGGPNAGGITSLDAAADLEFAWYRAQITSTLRSRWVRPILEDASGPIAATVVFEIHRDGSVTDVRIEATSGIAVMDRSVLRAVLESAPLPALPSAWRESSLSARYEFRFQPDEP